MKKYFLLVALVLMSGCATIGGVADGGSSSKITIVDSDSGDLLNGVQCKIYRNSATQNFYSPQFQISSNFSGHTVPSIECNKNGYKSIKQNLPKTMNGGAIWNVLWFPGFIVDTATGAISSLKLDIIIRMEKLR